ncbi:hypothetical protein FHL15_008059 [Xylaria flabelliformis]|uniref:Ankyrin repeat protein n=1 Tax=Xylaria flabelliformis TaxID=2512241 RepID=A0A553HT08_9PEZI|nr:hypothetical protein FHL15_008059 [Xylaria flabelliformis]
MKYPAKTDDDGKNAFDHPGSAGSARRPRKHAPDRGAPVAGRRMGEDGWSSIHYAIKIGDPELLHAVCRHRSFKKSAKTLDGKKAEVVAVEAGVWKVDPGA